MEQPVRAVAVDLGATSVRFAEGWLQDGRIGFKIVEQTPNQPVETADGPVWKTDTLLGICRKAAEHAAAIGHSSLGIDSWGVDHGFVDSTGKLLRPPACYRDPAHARAFDVMADYRRRLYALTGIQHQPFNTIYQLIARKRQDPSLNKPGVRWLILPELMHHLLGCKAGHELSQASTTQLMGLDRQWSEEAFKLAGFPVPAERPKKPGRMIGGAFNGVPIVRVGGHDTASAVCGMGTLREGQAFLNAGTWSLLGCLLDEPIATPDAEGANFTNERAVDGRVRFLANIPGFYVINRLHDELGVKPPIPQWLAGAETGVEERIDLFHSDLFNPESMAIAVRRQLKRDPPSVAAWASIALMSLVETVSGQLVFLESITGRRIHELRVAGGGSASEPFCQALANVSKRPVLAGPQEATVLGNLGVQFMAQYRVKDFAELGELILRSIDVRRYDPE